MNKRPHSFEHFSFYACVEALVAHLAHLGSRALLFVRKVGRAGLVLFHACFTWPAWRQSIKRWADQMYFVGVLSLVIMILSALFIGMVLGLQGYTILSRFGASQALGQLIALSLIRELAPVVGALLFAGRAGTALTSEIGLMKTMEQLASMEMMGVDPLKRVVAPRLWAGLISLPLLVVIFSAVAIWGGYLVGVEWLGVDRGGFWSNMQQSVDFWHDVGNGVIKSLVFGFVISWVAVYQGIDCRPTAEGIGRATTKTVVYSALLVLGLDFFLTAVMFS